MPDWLREAFVYAITLGLLIGIPVLILIVRDRISRRAFEKQVASAEFQENQRQLAEQYKFRLENPQVDQIEKLIGARLPKSYVQFMTNEVYRSDWALTPIADGEDWIVEFTPLYPDEEFDYLGRTKDISELFPFATDVAGDAYVLDLKHMDKDDCPVLSIWHEDPDHPTKESETFEEFKRSLVVS
jgi:hypothetical protein